MVKKAMAVDDGLAAYADEAFRTPGAITSRPRSSLKHWKIANGPFSKRRKRRKTLDLDEVPSKYH